MFPLEEMEELMIRTFTNYFTRQQLEAMKAFYETREGRSIAARGSRMTGPPVSSEGPLDTPQDRRVAAQRYFFEIDGKRLYGEMMRLTARRHYPKLEESEAFLWQATRDYSDFERRLVSQMETYNTRSEIEAWMRFHRTPDGRAMMIQFPLVMDEFLAHVLNVVRREAQRIKEERR